MTRARSSRPAGILFDINRPAVAACWFIGLSVVMTWPLTAHLRSVVTLDLVDPLLNCWILGWGAEHLLQLLGGDLGALRGFWNANIYHPEPLALAYSEHLVAQAVQVLPVYALTRDLVLCYNLLFLSTFALSALGMYLLVRELTRSAPAAFAAGLFYGFALYRAGHLGHLQVLSSQWMPFVLYGLRRYFEAGRIRALSGATLALIAQNLSCGYYLVYFSPFAVVYVAYEMLERGRARDGRAWAALAVAALVVVLATAPFLLPYAELRRLGFPPRPPSEVDRYSADVYSYLTAYGGLRVWGWLSAVWRKPEGTLFAGLIPMVLGAFAVFLHLGAAWRRSSVAPRTSGALRTVEVAMAAAAGLALAATALVLLSGKHILLLRRLWLPAANVSNLVPVALVSLVGLLLVSPRFRATFRGRPRSTLRFHAVALLASAYLSCGRIIETWGYRASSETVYDWLYRFVPGVDGLRVPSRFAMLVALFLAVVAGHGASALAGCGRRGRAIVFALCAAFLLEASVTRFEVQRLAWPQLSGAQAGGVTDAGAASRIYRYLQSAPPNAAIVELPFGDARDEARYMFFSTRHWRRLVNGYSGGSPKSYHERLACLIHPLDDPDRAWQAIAGSGARFVILHEWAYAGSEGASVRAWLTRLGAIPIARFRSDTLFSLRE